MNIFNYFRLKHQVKRQIRLCCKYSQLKSAIFVDSTRKLAYIDKMITSIIKHKRLYKSLLSKENHSKKYCEWRFSNRSCISCVCTNGIVYVKRLHSVVVDENISKDIKESVIAPIVTFYPTKKKINIIDMEKTNVNGYMVRNYWQEIPIKITARDTLEATTERRS